MKEKIKVLYWKVRGKKYTWLCPSCLRTGHLGNRSGSPTRCTCTEDNLICLGSRKLAEWVSQAQGDRKSILSIFDSWNYQSHWIKENRLLIYLYGFEVGGPKFLHPSRIEKLVRDGAVARHSRSSGAAFVIDENIWLIEGNKRYEIHPIESR